MIVGLCLIGALAQGSGQVAVPSLDSAFVRIRARQPGPAVAIAVWANDRIAYRNVAGVADLEHSVEATMATRFDWASIAKQFTAFAISLLVEQGRLAPDDRASRYLPELILDGSPVTIRQLLHHTAGLEDSDGLLALAGGQPGDKMPLDATVRVVLGQRHVRFPSGERSSYTNTGYLLLAEIVARVTGRPFAVWSDSAVFRPLGLRDTGFLDRPERLVPNRALPYVADRDGAGFLASVDETTPGPGGLYGTVDDLVTWARHVMAPRYQREATLRLRTRGALRSGAPLQYAWGLGWNEYRGQVTLSHGGSGPASNAFLLMFPDLGFAVAAASAGEIEPSVSSMAYRAADHFLAGHLKPVVPDTAPRRAIMLTMQALNEQPAESKGTRAAPDALARYPGVYRFPDGSVEVIRRRDDRLEMSWGGRPFYAPLWPLPDGRFALVPLWNAYRFIDSSGVITGVAVERTPKSLRRDGPESRFGTRLPTRRFDSTSAAPYLGLYYSDELETVYRVALAGSSLELRHPRHGALRLVPLEGDAFGIEGRELAALRFGRVGSRVVGLELEAVSWGATGSFRKLADPPPD